MPNLVEVQYFRSLSHSTSERACEVIFHHPDFVHKVSALPRLLNLIVLSTPSVYLGV
jgi:hypothetical protein